jgi:hypothetical protein
MLAHSLYTGFGLSTSAAALDGSAAALSAAAAELGAAAAGGTAKDLAKTAAGAGGIWAGAAAAAPWLVAGGGLLAGGYMLHQNVVDNNFQDMSLNDRLKATGGFPTIRGAYRRAMMGDALSSPELSPTTTYGTGVGGDKSVSVSGTVTGEGKVAVEVNAGSSLIDVVKRAEAAIQLAGSINSSGPGSLGRSSPDAAAPSAPISH